MTRSLRRDAGASLGRDDIRPLPTFLTLTLLGAPRTASTAIAERFSLQCTVMDAAPPTNADLPEVHCIHEVRLEIPQERLDEMLQFYGELMGLPPWPDECQIPGGRGLGDPACGLYLQYRHDPRVDPMQRRFTLVVSSLDDFAQRLVEHPWRFQHYRGLNFTDRRLLVSDPIGHLVEVRQLQSLM